MQVLAASFTQHYTPVADNVLLSAIVAAGGPRIIRDRTGRQPCPSNLRQIGQALHSYCIANAGRLPDRLPDRPQPTLATLGVALAALAVLGRGYAVCCGAIRDMDLRPAMIEAPTLTVDQPAESATFENGAIPVRGRTTNAGSSSPASKGQATKARSTSSTWPGRGATPPQARSPAPPCRPRSACPSPAPPRLRAPAPGGRPGARP